MLAPAIVISDKIMNAHFIAICLTKIHSLDACLAKIATTSAIESIRFKISLPPFYTILLR